MNPPHDPAAYARLQGLDPERLPRHVAIIMDGNGRWAVERGAIRVEGHLRGAGVVREIVTECTKLGIEALTLYCFSAENWKRPKEEVDFLMALFKDYLLGERELIRERDIRLRVIGRRAGIPEDVLAEVDRSVQESANNQGLTLNLAVNYGARAELLDAFVSLAKDVISGKRELATLSEEAISEQLTTAGLPDPDLLIRTAGELRISNFLLWQISYSEIWVTPKCWPDFEVATLHEALEAFAQRKRRFGGLSDLIGPGEGQSCSGTA